MTSTARNHHYRPESLRALRRALGLTQEEFARRLSVSFATVNRWERGHTQPGPATRERLAAIARLAVPGPGRATVGTLPAPLNEFVGRAEEMTELTSLLGAYRLVTITGTGGSGKTRLALETARRLRSTPTREVVFASFEGARPGDNLATTVARAAGVEEYEVADGDTLADALRERRLLLILDNCEHVAREAGRLAVAVMSLAPDISLLATSREALRLPGEQVFRLAPLPTNGPRARDAADLFIARATAAGAAVEPSPELAALCARLDGLPLAIELAAAWAPAFTPAQLLERLEHRFRLLADRGGGRSARQRTLWATIDWSYQLLPPAARALFDRLSIFPASFTLDAAELVCGAGGSRAALDPGTVLLALGKLVETCLVDAQASDTVNRYAMLESVRAFARERLDERPDEAAELDAAFRSWAIGLVREADSQLGGRDQALWLNRLAAESGNLDAALARAVAAKDGADAIALVSSLATYWNSRSLLREGLRWLELALALPRAGPLPERLHALRGAGVLARQRGDLGKATGFLEEALDVARELGQPRDIAFACNSLAGARHALGRSGEAHDLLREAAERFADAGDRGGEASALSNLGVIACDDGDYETAIELGSRALQIRLDVGHAEGIAVSYENLGTAAVRGGMPARASHWLRLALRRYQALGEPDGIATCLEGLAAVNTGRPRTATILCAAASQLRADTDVVRSPPEERFYGALLDGLREHAGFDRWWAAGLALDPGEATRLALAAGDRDGGSTELSPRERQVLRLLETGASTKEIARELGLSPRTVEGHLARLYHKTGSRGRADAIRHALTAGDAGS